MNLPFNPFAQFEHDKVYEVPVSLIDPNPFQQRLTFDDDYILELATSFKDGGLHQPVKLRPSPVTPGRFQLIYGECRLRGHKKAGLETIKALMDLKIVTDAAMEEVALIENTGRKDLRPIEEANGMQRLSERYDGDFDKVAAKTGKSRQTVEKRILLLQLDPRVQTMVDNGQITLQAAEKLTEVEEVEKQFAYATMIAKGQMDLNRLTGLVNNAPKKGRPPSTGTGNPKTVSFKKANSDTISLVDTLGSLNYASMKPDEADTLRQQLTELVRAITENVNPTLAQRANSGKGGQQATA